MAEEAQNELLDNRIVRTLAKRLAEVSFDSNFYETAKAHLKTVADYFQNDDYKSGHKGVKFIVAKFFWLKHFMFPRNQKFVLEEDPLAPVVYLRNKNIQEIRRKSFISVLKYNDTLCLKVSDVIPEEYELQIISFTPATSNLKIKLDDLELSVFLRRTPDEMLVLGELEVCDLIRAIPLRVDEDEQKCYVTVLANVALPLGKVSEEEAFVPDILSDKNCSNYEEAFDIIAPFKYPNKKLMRSLVSAIGIDPEEWDSYSRERNRKSYTPDSYADACLSEAERWTSLDLVKEAEKLCQSGQTEIAFELLDRAGSLWQNNLLLYEVRGKMYYESGDKEKAILDFETAFHLSKDTKVKELYSRLLFSTAMHFYKVLKNYEKAATMLCSCLIVNEKDSELFLTYLKKIKKLMPELRVPEEFADIFSRVEIKKNKACKDSPSKDSLENLIKKQKKIKRKLGESKKE